jgi:murein tripeptide amidase MpaA
MSEIGFDRYYRYAELSRLLRELADEHPQLLRVDQIGRSFEGREIWLATVTNTATGLDTEKPALWVDGNIHATEVAGSMACLYFIRHLVSRYAQDAEVKRCLDTRVFYVCPRINPDGAEWALADVPRLIRSSTRPYPHDEEPIGGLKREDVDGDGRVLTMRIGDPNGPWKVSGRDPRLLERRDPAETGGEYYRLLPEGRLEHYDGSLITLQPRREQLDLNRNFPAGWRQEHEQYGAGPFPASEPEVNAVASFIAAHPNIIGAVAFHTYSGVLLRPYSHKADDALPVEDLWTYQKIGARGTELTGYPNISVFHEFRYHPKEVITGSFDDWMYEHGGVFAWTVEIWSPQRQAGITDYKFIELGGWDVLYSWSNPPHALLEKEIERFPAWLIWQLLISPRLAIHEASAIPLGDHTWTVRLVVQNSGWLPSYVTKQALANKLTRGVVCEIELPEGARLETGKPREELGQLEGRAHKPATPSSWGGWGGDVTDDRAKVEWVVSAPKRGTIRLTARHERAGTVRTDLTL